jgi:hypothetical protein
MQEKTITEVSKIKLFLILEELTSPEVPYELSYTNVVAKYGKKRADLVLTVLQILAERKVHLNDFVRATLLSRGGKETVRIKISPLYVRGSIECELRERR